MQNIQILASLAGVGRTGWQCTCGKSANVLNLQVTLLVFEFWFQIPSTALLLEPFLEPQMYTNLVFLIFLLFSIFTSYIIKITQPWAVIVATVVSNSKQQWFPNQKASICPNLPAPVHPWKVQKCVPQLSNIETCWKILFYKNFSDFWHIYKFIIWITLWSESYMV